MIASSFPTVNVPTTHALFDLQTGQISSRFLKEMKSVGFNCDENTHIIAVRKLLKDKECLQSNPNFYLYKGVSEFSKSLNYNQALQFLEYENSQLEIVKPHIEEGMEAIVGAGVISTINVRLNALRQLFETDCPHFKKIHFITKNNEEKSNLLNLIHTQYQQLLQGIEINMIESKKKHGVFEDGIQTIADQYTTPQSEYIIISDSVYAARMYEMAQRIFPSNFAGICSYPLTWQEDMKLYRFDKIYKNVEKNIIALTASLWNLKASQVEAEWRIFEENHTKKHQQVNQGGIKLW